MLIFILFYFILVLYNFHISPVYGSIMSLHGCSQCFELDIHAILGNENYVYKYICIYTCIYELCGSCIRKQYVLLIKGANINAINNKIPFEPFLK